MRRVVPIAIVAALLLPMTATAGPRVAHVDLSEHPTVRVTVVGSAAPRLSENGVAVTPTRSGNLAHGKSLVVAVDRSRSMEGATFESAMSAARAFVARKSTRDRVSIVGFGSRSVRLTRFSSATIDADLALRGLAIDNVQGTALYDAVVEGAHALATEGLPARVIVVLTDGADTTSAASLQEAVLAARHAKAAVHTIGIESTQFDPKPLQRLAHATGGGYHHASSAAALSAVYAAIGKQFARTWQVEYLTALRPGERLTVRADGSTPVSLAVPGTPTATAASGDGPVPDVAYSAVGSLLLGLAVGGLVLLALAAARAARRGSKLKNRLAPHVERRRGTRVPGRRGMTSAATLMRVTERAFGTLSVWRRTTKLMQRANVPLRTVEFVYIVAGSALLALVLAMAVGAPAVIMPLALPVGGVVPYVVLWMKAKRRLGAFEEQLPDILLTISASLKAGHSFKHGLQSVADESEEPASTEFQRALGEIRLGRPVDDALREVAERLNSSNLDFVITAVTIQSQVGGSLASIFDMVADAVRQRQQFARKIRALTAMGRASAYVLVGLPFVLSGALALISRDYMEPLVATSQGRTLIVVGLVMIAFGSLVLKKIVSFRG